MSKDIKDFLHYYLGQQVLINNGIYENKVDFLTHINDVGDCAGKEYEWLAKDCQLILRKIEEMTEEEMKEYNKLISTLYSFAKGVDQIRQESATTHYLLKCGFDLFGLIDSGAALDAKTLQPQQQ